MIIALGLRKKVVNMLGLVTVGLLMSLYAETATADTMTGCLIETRWNADSDVRYSTDLGVGGRCSSSIG